MASRMKRTGHGEQLLAPAAESIEEEEENESGGPLTAQHERFITLLIDGLTIRAAAEEAGASQRSAYRWMAEGHAVRAEFSRRRAELVAGHDAAYRRLQARVLEILGQALAPDAPADARLEVAKFLYSKMRWPETTGDRLPMDAEDLMRVEHKAEQQHIIDEGERALNELLASHLR